MNNYKPEDKQEHFYFLERMANTSGVELDCNYPSVDIVETLVGEVIVVVRMQNNSASALVLDDSKLVHKFVKASSRTQMTTSCGSP